MKKRTKLVIAAMFAITIAGKSQSPGTQTVCIPITVCGDNGLNCSVASPLIELGGPLVRNTQVDLSGFNLLWGGSTSNGIFAVGDGFASPTTTNLTPPVGPLARINFSSSSSSYPTTLFTQNLLATSSTNMKTYGGFFSNRASSSYAGSNNIGFYSEALNNSQTNTGVWTQANYSSATNNLGILGSATYGSHAAVGGIFYASQAAYENIGVQGQARYASGGPTGSHVYYVGSLGFADRAGASGVNYGVLGAAQNDNNGLAVAVAGYVSDVNMPLITSGTSAPYPPNAHIAVLGDASDYSSYTNVIAPTKTRYAGYFIGDVMTTGTNYATNASWTVSDQRYKANLKKIESVNEKLKKISGYTYYLKTDEFKDKHFDKMEQMGLIAQELKEVFPQLVKEDKDGFYAVNYQGMIPVLLEAIKEQQNTIDDLSKKLSALEAQVNNNVQNSNSTDANRLNVELSDKNIVVLNQNVPNPFAENTTIAYNIPNDFTSAQILFYGNDGRLIKSVDIKTKGSGQLNVFANDLTSGIYSYTLVIDGKVINTMKMMKQ